MMHLSAPPSSQRRSLALALVAGIAYLSVLYALAFEGGYEFAAETTRGVALYGLWIGAGHLLLAGVSVYFAAEHRYLAPLLAFVGVAGYAVGVELGGSADSPLAIYGMFWLVPLSVILAAVGLEYAVRSRLRS